jgi:ABC-type uncharacterized transport system YnjBCD permease subunit
MGGLSLGLISEVGFHPQLYFHVELQRRHSAQLQRLTPELQKCFLATPLSTYKTGVIDYNIIVRVIVTVFYNKKIQKARPLL